MIPRLLQGLDGALAFWFQCECVLCGERVSRGAVCLDCWDLESVDGAQCELCGLPLPDGSRCGACLKSPGPLLALRSDYLWNACARELWHRLKYQNRVEIYPLFRASPVNLPPFPRGGNLTVVPVPLHPSRWWERGFNQSEWLAENVARRTEGRLWRDSLRRIRRSPPQVGSGRAERRRNVRGAFRWKGRLPNGPVLLVDDVFTTGSTLRSAAGALRRAGIREVYGWTLFRALGRARGAKPSGPGRT